MAYLFLGDLYYKEKAWLSSLTYYLKLAAIKREFKLLDYLPRFSSMNAKTLRSTLAAIKKTIKKNGI
jgi:hypothetical protein